ncbi:exopolysaccharide biosynthesis protein [Croceicoccus naphthovorans]|uniref:Membrane protein n=1 Tax=Croceicoccus naphthovorans TaxID=1348774 RepID=A0A0G3XHL0_9SPHN|nr:exopolysaccharide biosynthesis protein [Croceicoccus naphthovorans]AKM10687.1 membrane protein [Croceicoccus naphthovorans]MBB3992175.1 hypothetical protein [Croceicoccus naphthovorans]
MANDPHSVCEILDCLDEVADEHDKVSVGDVLDAIGSRSYGPFLLIPALLEITPVGAIPGVPTFLAVIIAIIALQMLFGRKHIWLPGFIRHRSVSADKVEKSSHKLRKIAAFLDKWFHGRLKALTHGVPVRIAALLIIGLCATVPPLEVLPFASSGPMLAIAAFGLGLMVRDGLLMLIATALSLGAFGLGFTMMGGEESSGG